MRSRGRKARRTRGAKTVGKKRIKEASIVLQQRLPGTAVRKGRVGGVRVLPPGWTPASKRVVAGFFESPPDPPKTPGRHKRRRVGRGRAVEEDDELQLVDGGRRAVTAAPVPAARPKATRAGARTTARRVAYKGKDGVWLSAKAYARLLTGRERAELSVQATRFARAQALRKPPRADRVATAALLQSSGGVSASKVPYVLAVVMRYCMGHIPKHFLFATSTALEYVRTAGQCLKQQLLKEIGDAHAPFFIGTDTSTRGGHLGSYVVAFVLNGSPKYRFLSFNRPASGSASDLTDALWAVVKSFTAVGGEFVGFSSDAPATMVGAQNGVAALLMDKAGFVRHDTCEFHASARLLAIIDALWPAQMNVPSVSQFVYLLWYILNDDWPVYRGRMIRFLSTDTSASAMSLLSRFSGDDVSVKRATACAELTKPEKPNTLRWNTLAEVIVFVPRYFEALRAALDEERINGGSNVSAGSIPAMCCQWVKWSGSAKLCALLSMAAEFVSAAWQPADAQIALPDNDYDVPGCFKTFSRPRRVLDVLMLIEARLANPTDVPSFQTVVDAFGDDQSAEVARLFSHMYSLARASVLRNSGRYLYGLHLFGGLADPAFALVVYEALAHWLNKRDAPDARTTAGQRLEKALTESEGQLQAVAQDFFDALVDDTSWKALGKLMNVLRRDKAEFVSAIVNAPEDNIVAYTLRSWRAALSHTQPVEKTFLDWDHQARGDGGTKRKATEPAGKGATHVTREAKVVVATVSHRSVQDVLAESKPNKRQQRVAAKDDVAAAVEQDFKRLTFSSGQLHQCHAAASGAQEHHRVPRGGVSAEIDAVFRALQQSVPGWVGPRASLALLLLQGMKLDISLNTVCSPSCLKIEKSTKKGAPGAVLSCAVCLRSFHIKCMVNDRVIDAGATRKDFIRREFLCESCGGSAASNRVAHGEVNDESISHPRDDVQVLNTRVNVHAVAPHAGAKNRKRQKRR